MKHQSTAVVLIVVSAVTLSGQDVAAQNSSLSTTGGSSLFSAGGSSFGSSSVGGTGGSFGQGGQGQTSQGFGVSSTTSTDTGFIGRSSDDVTNFFSAMAGAGGQVAQQNASRSARDRGREANATQDVRPPLMVKVSLGFTPPARPRMQISQATQTRLNGILDSRGLQGLSIAVADGVAVVNGQIASPGERMLIDRLARLEPGVTQVQFQSAAPNPLPTPPLE